MQGTRNVAHNNASAFLAHKILPWTKIFNVKMDPKTSCSEIDANHLSSAFIYLNNNDMTESKSLPPPFTTTKIKPKLAILKKSIKQYLSNVKQFNYVCEWDHWYIHIVAISRALDIQDINECKICPSQLWWWWNLSKQIILCAVFVDNLVASKDQGLVCFYESTSDAQRFLCDLVEHCTTSNTVDIEFTEILMSSILV